METKEKIESFLKDVKVWSFNVKFNTSDCNIKTFKEFKEFCKNESDFNYLQGIKTLLDFYKADYKYNSLYDLIEELQAKVFSLREELEQVKEQPKEQEEKPMFKTLGQN